jgi:hypothetical protein
MKNGFDASGFSGEIDFAKAKSYGMEYGIFRVGRGKPDGATNSYGIDKNWQKYKNGARSVGMFRSGYWRFFPDISMETQVSRFVQELGLQDGMLAPWLDIEDTGGLGPKSLTDWVIRCADLITAKSGRRPVIYTYKNFLDTKLEYWRLDRWEQAIAWQTSGIWAEYGSIFWQLKLDTPVDWCTGRVDLQKFALDDFKYHLFENELDYWIDADGMIHGPMIHTGKLLPESGEQGTQSNKVAIVHTMVGYLNGTDASFRNTNNGLESHVGIGGKYDPVDLDGAIYQWMKAWEIADANYHANPYAFSIETSDGGGNRYLEEWSSKQSWSLAQCLAAWCFKYDKPAKLVSRSSSSVPGIGHHKIGTTPGPKVPPDDWWSNPALGYRACPGQPRIDQLTDKIIPTVQRILASLKGGSTGGPGLPEDDMALDDIVGYGPQGPYTVRDALTAAYSNKNSTNHLTTVAEEQASDIKQLVIEESRKIQDLILVTSGQPSWENLAAGTWEGLENESWVFNH